MSKVISVLGAQSKSKRAFVFEFAKMMALQGKTTIITSLDSIDPLVSQVGTEEALYAVHEVITASSLTQDLILKSLVKTMNDKIFVAGYKSGDSLGKYPEILRNQMMDYLTLIRPLADVIMLVMSCDITAHSGLMTAVEMSDETVIFIDDTLYGYGYYMSQSVVIKRRKIVVSDGDKELIQGTVKDPLFFLPLTPDVTELSESAEVLGVGGNKKYIKGLEQIGLSIGILDKSVLVRKSDKRNNESMDEVAQILTTKTEEMKAKNKKHRKSVIGGMLNKFKNRGEY